MIKRTVNFCGGLGLLLTGLFIGGSDVLALDDQWYLGIGGGASWLQPEPQTPGLGVESHQGQMGTLIIGRDIDDRSSAQLQLTALGDAELETGEPVPYFAGDATIVYRFYDSRDRKLVTGGFGAAVYSRFGLGFVQRDTEVELESDASVYFGAGGGVEIFLGNTWSVRAEGFYYDDDAASGSLSLIARFGGRSGLPTPAQTVQPTPTPTPTPTPAIAQPPGDQIDPTTSESKPFANDTDGDGVVNDVDSCSGSTAGYPVRDNGCALFDGVLTGVTFVDQTAELVDGANVQMDYLANLLKQYPESRIELMAHTDLRGTLRDQSILTRARLRTVGTYLVQKGIRSNRLVLRSFGGTRPLAGSGAVDSQVRNNRIEVIEHPR